MNNKKYGYIISALCVILLMSGCAMKSESGASDEKPPETNQGNGTKTEDSSADPEKELLIIIDQTPKPTVGNSFNFVVKQVPEGFSLAELQWISKDNRIVRPLNTELMGKMDFT
ncbi:hypothetical protein [Sporosarcina obsidiansis]|uniref:hypothetical protein n=1 Tax=Sporosarcina obsidiansis TaxID=2660748 RepID=UPI001891F312|nr:hypothetical protein [Sporosarcina obsidiansis]